MKRIEKPLSNLLVDLCIPPNLATLILDTRVDENWIPAIVEFERRLDTLKLRVRVKAARDLSEVAEGLRIVVSSSALRLSSTFTFTMSGRHETPDVLSVNARTYTNKHDNQPASHPVLYMDEVPSPVHFPPTTRSQRCE